jgi:hypothetical protein
MIQKALFALFNAALLPCLVIHAYANGGNWRYTVEHYACGLDSITTKYEYNAPAPKDALTRDQLVRQLNQYLHDNLQKPADNSPSVNSETI